MKFSDNINFVHNAYKSLFRLTRPYQDFLVTPNFFAEPFQYNLHILDVKTKKACTDPTYIFLTHYSQQTFFSLGLTTLKFN